MKYIALPLTVSILVAALAGCSLLPPSGSSPSQASTPSIPPTGYEPQEDDIKLQRDQVFLDMQDSNVLIRESMPAQVSMVLNGNLPDPCHELRVVVMPINEQNEVKLEVYSIYDPQVNCITMIKPFTATIPLGSYAGGHFTVFVNDQLVGEFDA